MPGASLLRSLFLAAMIPVLCLGCGGADGPELAPVSGTVTLDGKPLPQVSIRFIPEGEGGSPSYGGTDASGQYKLVFNQDRTGAMLGKHRVEIEAREPETDDDGNPIAGTESVAIPEKYSEPGTLSAEVKSGQNTIDFALESK